MSARFFGRTGVALILALPVSAFAQGTTAPAATPGPATTTTAGGPTSPSPSPNTAPAAGGGAPAGDNTAAPAAPRAPVREATGYAPESIPSAAGSGSVRMKPGKSSKPPRAGKATSKSTTGGKGRQGQTGSAVVEPGFQLLESGGSRFFVELAQSVPIEERKAKGSIIFVLKGAHNALRNNLNPLVTEHFNTPVRRAKLARAGRDLLFVMELRQDVGATHQTVTNKEGHSVFQVDFAPGTFVKDAPSALPEPSDESTTTGPGDRNGNGNGAGNGAGNGNGNGDVKRAGPKP